MSILISNEMIQATGKTENLLKLELAIIMFKDYHISSGQAAEFAGLSLIEFRQELAKRDICINYDVADFQLELQTLNQLPEDLAEDMKNIEQLDNAQNISQTSLGFGEFIQKFRQEHNLAQEGIEPEELLKEVRDLSSGREVIW